MNKLWETLYDNLYTPLEQAELQEKISSCHHQLTKRLDKLGHKLLLKTVDDHGHFADVRSMDSFLCGSKLAWSLHTDANITTDIFPAMKPRKMSVVLSITNRKR